jgi:hypothetical protein
MFDVRVKNGKSWGSRQARSGVKEIFVYSEWDKRPK